MLGLFPFHQVPFLEKALDIANSHRCKKKKPFHGWILGFYELKLVFFLFHLQTEFTANSTDCSSEEFLFFLFTSKQNGDKGEELVAYKKKKHGRPEREENN